MFFFPVKYITSLPPALMMFIFIFLGTTFGPKDFRSYLISTCAPCIYIKTIHTNSTWQIFVDRHQSAQSLSYNTPLINNNLSCLCGPARTGRQVSALQCVPIDHLLSFYVVTNVKRMGTYFVEIIFRFFCFLVKQM